MENQVKKILSDILQVPVSDINESTSMQTIQKWDSLNHMQIVVSLEENFEIEPFSMDEIIKLTSYKSIIDILSRKLSN